MVLPELQQHLETLFSIKENRVKQCFVYILRGVITRLLDHKYMDQIRFKKSCDRSKCVYFDLASGSEWIKFSTLGYFYFSCVHESSLIQISHQKGVTKLITPKVYMYSSGHSYFSSIITQEKINLGSHKGLVSNFLWWNYVIRIQDPL